MFSPIDLSYWRHLAQDKINNDDLRIALEPNDTANEVSCRDDAKERIQSINNFLSSKLIRKIPTRGRF